MLVLKGGRNEIGSKAALSHTGAIAGTDAVYNCAFEQCGVVRVNTANELIAGAVLEARHLLEPEAFDLLSDYGIVVMPHVLARTREEAQCTAKEMIVQSCSRLSRRRLFKKAMSAM